MPCELCLHQHAAEQACPSTLAPPVPPGVEHGGDFVGSRVGNYRVVRELGRGGMGTVYLAEHEGIGSRVALKVLHHHLSLQPGVVQRFWSEARSVNLVGHGNIVRIFDFGALPSGQHYLVMEHLEGRSLADLTDTGTPMEVGAAVPLLLQISDALEAAHRVGVVHRDLKPENIMLVEHGRQRDFVKVLDFGIAKLLGRDAGSPQTAVGVLLGTPDYMAPEQVRGGDIDGRTDLYALGVIAWQLLAGRRPFTGRSLAALLHAHLTEEPAPLHQVNPLVDTALSQAVHRALEKDPAKRPQSAAEFAASLEDARADAQREPTRATPLPTQAPPRKASPVPLRADALAAAPRPEVQVWLAQEHGAWHGPWRGLAVTRGGLVVEHEGELPRLGQRLRLKTAAREGEAWLVEVVQHLSPERAQAWRLAVGFAVQFLEVDGPARQRLHEALAAPGPEAKAPLTDAQVERALRRFGGPDATPYERLGLPPDAACAEVSPRAQASLQTLERLLEEGVPAVHLRAVLEAQARVAEAHDALATPQRRAATDAALGNFAGVARCLEAGLAGPEWAAARAAHLQRPAERREPRAPAAAGRAGVRAVGAVDGGAAALRGLAARRPVSARAAAAPGGDQRHGVRPPPSPARGCHLIGTFTSRVRLGGPLSGGSWKRALSPP